MTERVKQEHQWSEAECVASPVGRVGRCHCSHKKKYLYGTFSYIECCMLASTYSPLLDDRVPLVMKDLTSVFGMGTGVPPSMKYQHRELDS